MNASDLEFTYYRTVDQSVIENPRGVMVTHLPTGMSASISHHQTQVENKAEAMRLLEEMIETVDHAPDDTDTSYLGWTWDKHYREAMRLFAEYERLTNTKARLGPVRETLALAQFHATMATVRVERSDIRDWFKIGFRAIR